MKQLLHKTLSLLLSLLLVLGLAAPLAGCTAEDAPDDVSGLDIGRKLAVGNAEGDGTDVVGDYAHCHVSVL